jgi:transcriptional regulator with XRE-family HTH domain
VAKFGVSKTVGTLGDYLREQRLGAQLSLRQLAAQTGVSNPYLSQIERGLRRPSAEVLQQLAKGLRISAETLYVRAGILNLDDSEVRSVELAVLADTGLTERQKQTLLDVYSSFRSSNGAATAPHAPDPDGVDDEAVADDPDNPDHHPDQTDDPDRSVTGAGRGD